ncbi:MAG: L-lysine 6-transaminase [Ignavibacterium sp.]
MNLNEIQEFEVNQKSIQVNDVHKILSKYMLADGFDLVLDLQNSFGSHLIDEKTGEVYVDFFSFFASNPLGLNHPKINNQEFKNKLALAAVNKPSNSDIYTTFMAEFVNTFATLIKPENFKHLFFVDGGSVAVENGLKVAFDWKVQKNFQKGYKEEKGTKVLHFREAFHGRTGYTLSLTNTDPVKTKYFPKFNWPRVINPKIKFPLENHLDEIIKLEEQAVNEIYMNIKEYKDDIAVIIIEPIQGEGGDNFFRKEFFLKLREIADENEILLMFDEVQSGFGLTGKLWASEYYVMPDIISFGKKAQTCGIMVSDRIDDVEENCFRKSSRINSTWGGNLVDMVRSTKIIETIFEEYLIDNAKNLGEYLLKNLVDIQNDFPNLINNTRGLGLMCSFDFNSTEERNLFLKETFKNKLLILGCGTKTVRFRPSLAIIKDELDEGLKIVKNVLNLLNQKQ